MLKKLNNIGVYIILLVVGEIITISAGILDNVSTEEISYMVIGYFGIVTVFSLVSVVEDSIAKTVRKTKMPEKEKMNVK